MRLDFDPEEPPPEPPPGCPDPTLWSVAVALHRAHQPRLDGWCACREFYPCAGHRLAVRALVRACRPGRNQRWLPGPPLRP